MRIFLSSEAEHLADEIISPLRAQVTKQINLLLTNSEENYYGEDISILCIISTCVSDEFLKDSNWKERIRYSKKDKSTDIRININYSKLLSSSKDKQFELYLNNILQSIEKFHLKYPKLDFQASKLIDDIKNACRL